MRRPRDAALYAFAAAVTLFAVVLPFASVRYPPLTDFPFHVAETSILRHFWDPSFHFREQFELTPISVPYLSSYVLGAALMLVMPAVPAAKTAAAILLLSVPLGLSTLAWGMRKSPLLGLAGAPLMWGSLTHWGFVNFVSALGLFAAAIGLTLRVLDRPTRANRSWLATVLVVLFFTHVFRVPFAIVSIVATTAIMFPATRRIRPVLAPLVPCLLLFAAFWLLRPPGLTTSGFTLAFDSQRLPRFFDFVIGSFTDPAERTTAKIHGFFLAAVAAANLFVSRAHERHERTSTGDRFARAAALAVAAITAGLLLGFLTLPLEIGAWWYVFPREATATLLFALALIPDLPRSKLLRWSTSFVLAVSLIGVTSVVSRNWRTFDRATRDFAAITADLPRAPKLLYLVFDHSGSTRTNTPFLHLPAYVQAERGGWLSFHFASFGAGPIRYRSDPEAVVPPPVPRRWEWTPRRFRVEEHAEFFDLFLVRAARDPQPLFAADGSIALVRREGSWWLFRREPEAEP